MSNIKRPKRSVLLETRISYLFSEVKNSIVVKNDNRVGPFNSRILAFAVPNMLVSACKCPADNGCFLPCIVGSCFHNILGKRICLRTIILVWNGFVYACAAEQKKKGEEYGKCVTDGWFHESKLISFGEERKPYFPFLIGSSSPDKSNSRFLVLNTPLSVAITSLTEQKLVGMCCLTNAVISLLFCRFRIRKICFTGP